MEIILVENNIERSVVCTDGFICRSCSTVYFANFNNRNISAGITDNIPIVFIMSLEILDRIFHEKRFPTFTKLTLQKLNHRPRGLLRFLLEHSSDMVLFDHQFVILQAFYPIVLILYHCISSAYIFILLDVADSWENYILFIIVSSPTRYTVQSYY